MSYLLLQEPFKSLAKCKLSDYKNAFNAFNLIIIQFYENVSFQACLGHEAKKLLSNCTSFRRFRG